MGALASRELAALVIALDVLLGSTLSLFLLAWWRPALPRRDTWLWLLALFALMLGSVGFVLDRWQAGVGAAVAVLLMLGLLSRRLRRSPSSRVPWLSGGLFGLLVVLAVAVLWLFPLKNLPALTGPYAIGVRDFELVDKSRHGLLGVAPDAPRRLLVRVWYPASPTDGAHRRAYFNAQEARTTARGVGTLLGFPPLLSYLRYVSTNAYEDAPLATTAGKLPVVFFSHGYTAYTAADTALMEELASHGYAVYSVQHSGDASPTLLPGGDVIAMDPELITHMHHVMAHGLSPAMVRGYTASNFDERLEGQLRVAAGTKMPRDRAIVISAPIWLADRLFVHDALQAGSVPANVTDLIAASDFAHTGEMGMSFGGSTTGAVCMVDRRCAAAVNLDGGDFHFNTFDADLPVPLLMFHADLGGFYRMLGVQPQAPLHAFNDFSYERFERAGLRRDIYRPVMKGAVHAGFTDNGLFVRRPLRDLVAGTAPVEVLVGATNAFVLGFFDRYLRGVENGFPQMQYQQYAGWIEPHDISPVRLWWLAKPAAERATLERRIEAIKARRLSQKDAL